MTPTLFHFHRVHPEKCAICFTFDDNFSRHRSCIAPIFLQRGFRCTFYLNPGEEGFKSHIDAYKALLAQGFEIGSHGYTHENLSGMPLIEAEAIVKKSALSLQQGFGVYPSTFAFPYHDDNEQTLNMVKSFHLETRNTLTDSTWFAIKSHIPLKDMITAIKKCIDERRPLVFSGHSVVFTPEEAQDESLKDETGYNPILLNDLIALLDFLKAQSEHVQVLTFEQAAMLAFIRQNGKINKDTFIISQPQLDALKPFGIDIERLSELMSCS